MLLFATAQEWSLLGSCLAQRLPDRRCALYRAGSDYHILPAMAVAVHSGSEVGGVRHVFYRHMGPGSRKVRNR